MTQTLLNQVPGRDDRTCSIAPYERQARGAPVTIGDEYESGDEVIVAALVGRVLRLQEQISGLASDAADTEQQLAVVCRQLAKQNPARSSVYLAAAHEADRFAAHKRRNNTDGS